MNPDPNGKVDTVESLLRIAGRREPPPAAAYARVRPAAEAAWRERVRQRQRRRTGGWLAAAAVLVAAVTASIVLRPAAPPPVEVAQLDRIIGTVETRGTGGESWREALASPGAVLLAGSRLRTGATGRAGLLLDGQVSLRVDGSSAIELIDAGQLRLLRGTVYVDTGADGHGGRIRLVTDAGIAQDFGTQFELRYANGALRLRVREGRVVIERDAERLVADAGHQLAVDGDGHVDRSLLSASDPAWRWIETLSPAPPSDGQPVAALLGWAARETGRELRYLDGPAERAAETTIVYGRLPRLPPLEVLDAALATTGLRYDLGADGAIRVSLPGD